MNTGPPYALGLPKEDENILLPNFFIVGAAKSGTSSLDRYLNQHPNVYISAKKEAHYFSIPDFPSRFEGPGDDGMNDFTIRDKESYTRLFERVDNETAIGESSAFYLYYPGTAQRIHDVIPNAKIIILLRNPVERAFSAYMHLIRDEREQLNFRQSLELEDERKTLNYEPLWYYKELGLYSEQIKRYLDVFKRSQVKIVLFEEFTRNPRRVAQDIFKFLEVDSKFQINTSVRYNESGAPKARWLYHFIARPNGLKEMIKPLFPHALREKLGLRAKSLVLERTSMDPVIYQELQIYFADDIQRLKTLLNIDLSIWDKRI